MELNRTFYGNLETKLHTLTRTQKQTLIDNSSGKAQTGDVELTQP